MQKEKYNLYIAGSAHFANNFPSVCLDGWLPLKSEKLSQNCPCCAPKHALEQNKEKIDIGYSKVTSIEKELFPVISEALNKIHGINHSERYWMILIGHCLRRNITNIYNNYSSVTSIFDEYDIQAISLLKVEREQVAMDDYSDYVRALGKDYFYSYIVEQIINTIGHGKLISNNVDLPVKVNKNFQQSNNNSSWLKKILHTISHIFSIIESERSPVITQTYLGWLNEALLSINFLNFPRFFSNSNYPKNKVNINLRDKFKNQLISYNQNSKKDLFKTILISLIPDLFPKAYLEDFHSIVDASNALKLPKNPRFILTANRFLQDEVFKVWISKKTEQGVPYFVLQHGSNYGEIKYLHPTVEEITSDKFFTWGWSYEAKHIKGFMFKKIYKKPLINKIIKNKKTNILFMEKGVYSRAMLENGPLLYKKYLNCKEEFFYGLRGSIRKSLLIRPHGVTHIDKTYQEIERWKILDSNIKIDKQNASLKKSVANSRLVLCFYHGTSFLEMLAANVPVLCFLDGLNEMNREGKDAYEILIKAGVCHTSISSLVDELNDNWDDCISWWSSDEIQNARNDFCSKHLRISNNPVLDLKNLISVNLK